MREMTGDGGNHDEELGLQRISYVSQYTIPNVAGTSADLMCNYTDRSSPKPNQASRTPDFSYPLVSSTLFSSLSPSLSFLSTTLPSLQNTKIRYSCLSVNVMIMSVHRVQHTPSRSIHRVQA